MRIVLRRTGIVAFVAENDRGDTVHIAGSADLEARVRERIVDLEALPKEIGSDVQQNGGMRPMELFLVSLAGCSAMDMVLILTRQREPLTELVIETTGTRRDETPATFEDILLRVQAPQVNQRKLARAATLSVEKYCSVRTMLRQDVRIRLETGAPSTTA